MKPYPGPWVVRSMLFVPGHNEKLTAKAASSAADMVVLDLEDAVPDHEKPNARPAIRRVLRSGLFAGKTVFVRINPIETGLTLLDLDAVACRELHGFVYPMAHTPDDIKAFDAQLRLVEMSLGVQVGHFSLIPLIETPLAVLNAYQIARASERIVGLLFGCEDYFAELQGRHSDGNVSLGTPRALVAMAARAAAVEPIDTPYVNVHDLEGLAVFARQGRDLGMGGMLVMTLKQVLIVHEAYTPSAREVEVASAIVSEAERAAAQGVGIAVVDGMFISPPTVKASRKVLERRAAIDTLEAFPRG